MNTFNSMIFVMLGFISVVLFHANIYFPIWLSVLIMTFIQLYFLQQFHKKRIGLLVLLIWFIYALPFIHIPPYIWFDFNQEPILLWGLAVNPYMLDQRVIELTAMMGAVGCVGLAFGASLNKGFILQSHKNNSTKRNSNIQTMTISIWLVWVVLGVVLTWLSAPQDTIFTSAYTESKSVLDSANFSSSWMMSYVILTFSFCDALLEGNSIIKTFKMKIIFAAVFIVVVYFQLLRGDRESVPWVFGLALLYYYWAASFTGKNEFRFSWLKLCIMAIILLIVSMVFGAVRSGLTGASFSDAIVLIGELYESKSIGLANVLHGTWSAALLTPLSVSGDHINGLLSIKWGMDYIDLLLSIIPGFFADAIGYIRPIDGNHGPAWEMRYGMGGTHGAVVPFMNFRMAGVFLVLAVWSYMMVSYEKLAMREVSVIKLSLLVTIAMASPHWLWYGEKNIMNAFIIWLLLSFFYRISLKVLTPSINQNKIKIEKVEAI